MMMAKSNQISNIDFLPFWSGNIIEHKNVSDKNTDYRYFCKGDIFVRRGALMLRHLFQPWKKNKFIFEIFQTLIFKNIS